MTDYLANRPTKIIAIEEHFATALYHQHVPAMEYRKFFFSSRSKQLGHDVLEQLNEIADARLRHMDEAGIDIQVLSFTQPGAQGFPAEIAIPLARDTNDRLYEAIENHPDRFAGFGAIPTADPDAAVREFERCIRDLGFKGIMIHGHIRGPFLDEKRFWGIFEAGQSMRVPIYLHPTMPHPGAIRTYFSEYEELQGPAWGFAIDTATHFLRIVFADVFDAYPDLKIILGHLGEGLRFGMHRMNDHTYRAAQRRGLKRRPIDYLRDNLVVTTSGNWYEPAFFCTVWALGIDGQAVTDDEAPVQDFAADSRSGVAAELMIPINRVVSLFVSSKYCAVAFSANSF